MKTNWKPEKPGRSVLETAAGMLLLALLMGAAPVRAQQHPPVVKSPRLYVFDCGTLQIDPARYHFKPEELASTNMSAPCFLIAHPKGTLMWDVGVIPDSNFQPGGGPVTVKYPTSIATARKPLLPQLAEAGYTPSDITFFALSHFHYDHVANANAFAGSTWLVRKLERDIMFTDPPSPRSIRAFFSDLANSKTVIVKDDEYDVFGDGTVILKSAPGHSPDHQVLLVKLAKTGPVLLSGDLWHYPEERPRNLIPATDFNPEQTAASRAAIEAYLKKTGAQLWIQHDFTGNAKLRKAPQFYE